MKGETLARLESDDRWRNVRMTPALMLAIAEATTDKPVRVEWGEPDAEGFYTPTITVREILDKAVER